MPSLAVLAATLALALVLAVAEVVRRPRPSFANISRVHIYLQGDHDFKFNSIRVPYGQTVPC